MNLGRDAMNRVSTQALKTVRATNKCIIDAIYAAIHFVLRRIMRIFAANYASNEHLYSSTCQLAEFHME